MPDTARHAICSKLTIVGCGKVGQTLGYLWNKERFFNLHEVLNRSDASARKAISFMGGGEPVRSFAELRPADVFLLSVPDDQIAAAASELAKSDCIRPGTIVFHCSGALPSTIMHALKDRGAIIASAHPIKSFASPDEATASFAGTWCGLEGDAQALDVLRAAFLAIGARPVELHTEDKLIYHAAAVFASNYLVTLLDIALQAYVKAGIPEPVARELVAPLVKGTLDNVVRTGTEQALTGPIARGDIATAVHQYRAVTAWNKRYGALYKHMGKLTGALAARRRKQDGS